MKNNRRNKKVRNYIIICAMLAIILSVSTYAWFIGLQDVKVNSFDVTIKAADSLRLSLDGVSFTDTLKITQDAVTTGLATSYASNTNAWATNGLTPVSTIGEIDTTLSQMKLYEKASLTASPDDATAGGYRLLASRVKPVNTGKEDSGYYVVFDLFVENSSGTEYYSERNILNEEAIYLLTDSTVTVASTGVEGTGIENSVRVGFAQIGRMIKGSGAAIQSATCNNGDDEGQSKTGICYTATIWEPNDAKHVAGAINWYSESCATRKADGENLYAADAYNSTSCNITNPVAATTAYSTSAVAREVAINDYVDIYDGYYNSYYSTVSFGEWTGTPLYEVDYFTDTEKNLKGTSRPTFMTLAPNSLTKVRVYVWIEGQDIDNYDYAMAGKTISVNFGFTKERFETTDVSYTGPFVETDVTTIKGNLAQAKCEAIGGTFTDDGVDGASANDVCTVSYGRFMRAATADEETYSASTFVISTTHKSN